jgi:Flp pilus assembly protein TadG
MRRAWRDSERGAVAVLVAVLLAVLIGAVGLALDLGRLFIVKTELQNASDACALAAARELNTRPTTTDVLTRAENAGITVGNRHFADLQDTAVRFVTDRDVTFSPTLDGSYVTKGSAPGTVRYVRCSRQMTGLAPWLMQVLGAGPQDVAATAVASMQPGITACGIPLAMCMQKPPVPCASTGVAPDAFGLCKGQWYVGGLGSLHITGNFNWIDYTPHGGGASEVENEIAGPGVCNVNVGDDVHAETGNMQSLKDAWNSRFGLYKNKFDTATAVPDTTGYAYGPTNWPLGRDAYADFLARRVAFAPYPTDKVTGLDTKGFKPSSVGEHRLGGDRRVVSMPVVDCSTWGSGHTAKVHGWACALMIKPWPDKPTDPLELEYLGPMDASGAPCGNYGLPGGVSGTGPAVPTLVQ